MNAPPDIAITKALEAATRSPCHKSKRGVAAFIGEHEYVEVLDLGFNGPPDNSDCGADMHLHESQIAALDRATHVFHDAFAKMRADGWIE